LSVSQAIVEAHSGRLWAESNPDRGVTFYLTLPVVTEEPSHEYCHV
jgi:two-component system, LuxR family, sensor kinase FixL